MSVATRIDEAVVAAFKTDGYAVAIGLFTTEEAGFYAKYFTDMVERGGDGWSETVVDATSPDPLIRYPRLLQPHRNDKVAFDFMLDPRIRAYLGPMAGEEPFGVQTMVYFKPPGARGQALHQDNMYLLVEPGTCMAAWMALDDCDEENGCMVVVPGSQNFPIICQVKNEMEEEQWGGAETPLPPGSKKESVIMKKGDVLFFNGSLIHGSYKNRSTDRFRRTLIGHYIAAEARQVAKYYFPVFRMDGTIVEGIELSVPGGPCGVYENGEVAMSGQFKTWEAAH
jgi:hypothetical protein